MRWLSKICRRGRPALEPERPREFGFECPPDWVVEISRRTLPHGSHSSMRLLLAASPPSGTARLSFWPRRGSDDDAILDAELGLRPKEVEAALDLLGACLSGEVADPMRLFDGTPVSVVVHRRLPYEFARTDFNVSAWRGVPGPTLPPVVRLAKLVMEIEERESTARTR